MIYVLISYLFYPLLQLIIFLKKRQSQKHVLSKAKETRFLAPFGITSPKQGLKKVLIIQTAKIGDLICSTPLFREIKKKYPDVHLTVMANPVTKALLEYNPYVDEIIAIKNTNYKGVSGKLKLSNLIRRGNYDVSICLNPNVPFAIAMVWGLVPIRISVMPDFTGTTFKLASVFFTHLEKHIRGRLVIETYMKMLKGIGIESNNMNKEVYKSPEADKKVLGLLNSKLPATAPRSRAGETQDPKLIGIAVSSGNKLKELGSEKTTILTNTLLDNDNIDAYIVLIGSNQDRDTANIILNSISKKDRVIDTVGKLSLSELPSLIEKLSLFIGVDTGITYMADALSVPIIDIAGPSDISDQRPLSKNSIIIQKDVLCVPCSHTFKAPYSCKRDDRICITSVSITEIVEAAKKLLIPVK